MERVEEKAGSIEEEDRISQLPEPILQNHILSLLPQNDAVRTCVLSKSWRHLGPTRPKFEFDESSFPEESKDKFISVVENTLKRYADQNLPIQEFILRMSMKNSESITLLLNKWIPIVLMKNICVKTVNLLLPYNFSLPSVVFQAEILEELYLKYCKLDQINNCIVKLQMLKRLELCQVHIEDVTFEKIMLSCPLIEHLVLDYCVQLSIIKVNKARNLKHFVFRSIYTTEINDDAPSLETIHITCCENWYHVQNNNFFPHLKSLDLRDVHLPTELLTNLSSSSSNYCPCLEELQLHSCSGFTEFKLSNRSIKRLIISISDLHPIEVIAIDAENLLYFEYKSGSYLPSISFATTSREWMSCLHVCRVKTDVLSTWLLTLHEFLKALCQSQIYLDPSYFPALTKQDTYDGVICDPVVVDHLRLSANCLPHKLPSLFNSLFRICRPRYIGFALTATNSQKICERQLAESIWKTLVKKRECDDFWQQDLEESSFQVLEENAHEWPPVHECKFSNKQHIRFRLKWRGLS